MTPRDQRPAPESWSQTEIKPHPQLLRIWTFIGLGLLVGWSVVWLIVLWRLLA